MPIISFIGDVIKKYISSLDSVLIPHFFGLSVWDVIIGLLFVSVVINFLIQLVQPVSSGSTVGDRIITEGRLYRLRKDDD